MSQSRLFDYNSSFAVIRTNPKLTGNFKISVDSQGGVYFNSMNVNDTLSNDAFKNFNISGENSYATDVSDFFRNGKISNDLIFQVGNFTNGQAQSAQDFSDQYDFFYASGASSLADKNYPEDFSYFAPLWIKNEIPDFFVIFKLNDPLDYPYSKNVNSIEASTRYKVIQDFDSTEVFKIAYGKTPAGTDIYYSAGEIFTGKANSATYSVISGSGKVAIYNELEYLPSVNDVSSTFRNKILNKATAIKTFDLRENTKIGNYIRSIFNNDQFSNSPLEVSWGYDSYTYYKGASISDGVYTKKGELLNQYLSTSKSDPMIDLEDYVTSGFSRNGIICPNLLNLEFFFDDADSDLYTINRYIGMYVSRNDIATIRSNGNFFYEFRNMEGNENTPIPSRNNVGYYYNNTPYEIGATSGVRIFYENGSGFLPGSDNVNLLDPNKLFYVTDKNDSFYSLKRSEDYAIYGGTGPTYSYGPYSYTTGTFSATGSTGATSGSLVLQNKKINLLNFTGSDDKLATIKGELALVPGRAYTEIEFLKAYDKQNPLTFKIFWPNGSIKEGPRRYDIISSGDYSSILIWTGGSYYSTGNSYYFNASSGTTSEIASALASVIKDMDESTIDSGYDASSSILRVKNPGTYGNTEFSISIFDDYKSFESKYAGTWDNKTTYSADSIVLYDGNYYKASGSVGPTGGNQFSANPEQTTLWQEYSTFSYPGYVKINGTDASQLKSDVNFIGGTVNRNNRIIFSSSYSDLVLPGYYVNTESGYSMIESVNKFVDVPKIDPITRKTIGFTDFSYKLVLNLKDIYTQVDLGSDQSFNVYDSASLNIGVFTFFDTKEFNFDFWSSDYGYTPNPETYKYFEIQPNTPDSIEANIPYFVKKGQISYAGNIYNAGNLFYGATGYTSFAVSDPSLNLSASVLSSSSSGTSSVPSGNVVVFPAQYSDVIYNSTATSYTGINYTRDLESFSGFLGIQGLLLDPKSASPTKEQVFYYGKLNTEYDYLKENYTTERSNISRIVPYINKWGSSIGTDSRGNRYRLNSSPAFSPTNFSPSFDKIQPDPKYLTHEWFLLEQPPRYFPKEFMNDQNSYLPYKIDLNKAKSSNPDDALYLSSYFTVDPSDYAPEFSESSNYTKELFTPLVFNQASGFYETIFRGVKIVLKKRSDVPNTGTVQSLTSDRYIKNYRGYEDYKFSAILRAIPEDNSIIQAPVKYSVIENEEQKFVLFVCDFIVKDQKAFDLGYTGGTGGNPILDYTLLYTLNDKEKIKSPLVSSQNFYEIDDIKLSAALDLSLSSGSSVNTTHSPGVINIVRNDEYDTDLREEIHSVYVENAVGATGGPSSSGPLSFSVSAINTVYPWPTGVGPTFVEFGRVATGSSYLFSIPFSTSSPVTVPVGPSSVYKKYPVIQSAGGSKYYKSLLGRCSVSYIADKFNLGSPYISYRSYEWDSANQVTVENANSFELYFEKPTKITKPSGSLVSRSYNGPQALKGARVETGYRIDQAQVGLPSIITRYSGEYEPLFRKVIHFDRDKTDTIAGSNSIDLSFRNCNFAPDKKYFGISRNLSFTKVSQGSDILAAAVPYPEGPVYPLIGLTPIDKKDFNLFSSSWDPGYYRRYTSATVGNSVAGTRSMLEYKTFFGSKVMQTPDPVQINNYITLEISRTSGLKSPNLVNSQIDSYIESIQNITKDNSNTGIGSVGPYLSGVDFNKLDLNIFPNAEIIWQNFPDQRKVKGIIRLDRMLRRFLLNSGIKKVFIDNMISEFGVGDPKSINDDVNNYIDLNVSPLYQGQVFNFYLKKVADEVIPSSELVRGDLFSTDRYKLEYFVDSDYKLVTRSNLTYEFEYPMDKGFSYSMMFNFTISKI